ncbi:PREDICTED: biliverdin reductase A isoform X2 [Lepidothrix coronata]|uniref:Biliverdin reductase A isoform X2 n=1 Tax=Lepidothrix coronata TaxID=321398 RepID=A0A6J0HTV3_9PASS|nr:PREDICTED: biliverdin reductase A isoform X2 [Lepidothrix coronata]
MFHAAFGGKKSSKMFGTVVVGVGIAGLARIRDLMNPMPSSPSEHLKLLGFVSRRSFGNINEAKQISLEDALRSKEVHAAFISTENRSHEETIRMFLEAGKHVLVEYPMALSAKAAHELWEMAEQKDKVLHVEHIELLTEEYKQLKKEVAGKDLVKGTLHFTGSVLDENKSGFPAFSGIARLTWLIDLFGDLTVTSATREKQKDKNYSRMTVHFQTANKKPLTWIEERGPGMRREKKINFCFTSGCLENFPEAPRSSVGLFMQDQNLFAKKLLGQVSKEELAAEKWRILRCLDLAEVIQQYCEEPEKIYS